MKQNKQLTPQSAEPTADGKSKPLPYSKKYDNIILLKNLKAKKLPLVRTDKGSASKASLI